MKILERYIVEVLREECEGKPKRRPENVNSQEDIAKDLDYFYYIHPYYENAYRAYEAAGKDISKLRKESLNRRENQPIKQKIKGIGNFKVYSFSEGFLGSDSFVFVVDENDKPLTYVALKPFGEGLAISNVRHLRGNGYYVTDVYASIVKGCGVLYSDTEQTAGGESIWRAMIKFSKSLGIDVFEPKEENDCRWMCRVKSKL